jgi:asparagine synthase (glutamine-hydrolysing)
LDLSFDPEPQSFSLEGASFLYLDMLRENTLLRLRALSEKSPAFTLSSGLDSSSVACLAAEDLGRPLPALTMSYSSAKGTPYDETPKVKELCARKGWDLGCLEMGAPDLLGEAERLMGLTKAPIATVTWLAHYHLAARAAERGFAHLFSGLGGDESLAGEFEHFFVYFADLKAQGREGLLDEETMCWARLHGTPEFPKGREARDAWLARNIDFPAGKIRVDQPRYTQFREWFEPDWVESWEKKIPPPPMETPYPFFLSNRLYQEMTHETSPPTLWSEALASRAAGVRGVFPMASPKLFRLLYSLPGTFKYHRGFTKMILRRAMKGILPDSSRLNPVKTGFNAPLDSWLKGEKTAAAVLDLIMDSPLGSNGWLKKGAPEKIVSQHAAGQKNNMMLLWPLIQTALFLRQL